ncbi:MAG: DUF5808 domain-containing protein [Clostridia bacterium]
MTHAYVLGEGDPRGRRPVRRGGPLLRQPDDPACFVPKRFGYGYTINMGHPASLVGAVAVMGLLVAAPVLRALARYG